MGAGLAHGIILGRQATRAKTPTSLIDCCCEGKPYRVFRIGRVGYYCCCKINPNNDIIGIGFNQESAATTRLRYSKYQNVTLLFGYVVITGTRSAWVFWPSREVGRYFTSLDTSTCRHPTRVVRHVTSK